MSISTPSTSYISHDTIDAWMQMKVGDAYSEMREGMDVSGSRADAEQALNGIKAKLAEAKNNGGKTDGNLSEEVTNVLQEFGAVPGVKEALNPILEVASDEHVSSTTGGGSGTTTALPPIKLSSAQVDAWTSAINDTVDALGKQDQLGMIHLNALNSHINQTEQLASALIDSRNKTTEAIINRIG